MCMFMCEKSTFYFEKNRERIGLLYNCSLGLHICLETRAFILSRRCASSEPCPFFESILLAQDTWTRFRKTVSKTFPCLFWDVSLCILSRLMCPCFARAPGMWAPMAFSVTPKDDSELWVVLTSASVRAHSWSHASVRGRATNHESLFTLSRFRVYSELVSLLWAVMLRRCRDDSERVPCLFWAETYHVYSGTFNVSWAAMG